MTLRHKLILWYTGLLGIILVFFGVALFGVTRWTLIKTLDTSLAETTDMVLNDSAAFYQPDFGPPSEVRMRLPELEFFRAPGMFVQIWELSDTRQLAGRSNNLEDFALPLDVRTLGQAAAQGAALGEDILNDSAINDGLYRVLTRTFMYDERLFAVQTATSLATVNKASRELLVIISIGMAVAMLGSVAMALGFSRRALKPIDRVTKAAARIAATDDLKTRLEYKGPMDEIGRMNSVFNHMMDRLESLFHVQQRFVADVSHELRTPLTAIRGNLDLIKRYGADKDSLEAIEGEAERMSRLVADLLLLARADYGGLKLDLEPLDLDTTISEIYRNARVLAKDRNLTVVIRDFEPVRVMGDPDRLKQLFLNLVSNAIKFTPEGGSITINLRRTYEEAVIEVIDTGIGIAPEDLPRIFDRFYQADPARVRKGEGSGLGLSIAKWIVEAHGGHVEVTSDLGVGTTFTVFIPHIEEKSPTPHAEVTRPRGVSLMRRVKER
jgi:heavy metal sensor kinase